MFFMPFMVIFCPVDDGMKTIFMLFMVSTSHSSNSCGISVHELLS